MAIRIMQVPILLEQTEANCSGLRGSSDHVIAIGGISSQLLCSQEVAEVESAPTLYIIGLGSLLKMPMSRAD